MSSPYVVERRDYRSVISKAIKCYIDGDVECLIGILSSLTGKSVGEIKRMLDNMDKTSMLIYLMVVISRWI